MENQITNPAVDVGQAHNRKQALIEKYIKEFAHITPQVPKMASKQCEDCQSVYTPNHIIQKYCKSCQGHVAYFARKARAAL